VVGDNDMQCRVSVKVMSTSCFDQGGIRFVETLLRGTVSTKVTSSGELLAAEVVYLLPVIRCRQTPPNLTGFLRSLVTFAEKYQIWSPRRAPPSQ
jgi:hypothetical protein